MGLGLHLLLGQEHAATIAASYGLHDDEFAYILVWALINFPWALSGEDSFDSV